jgi:hypothetical protein
MNMSTSTSTKLRMQVCAAATAALALAAGCASDAPVLPEEPTTEDAQAVTVAASPDTAAKLDIATWRYQPTSEGVVVRGLGAGADASPDAAARVRFWISAGDTSDELVAHGTDTGAQVVVLREGGVRGDDAGLRDAVTAFRADVEAAQADDKKGGAQNINDNVHFCLGNTANFTTWAFWATTKIWISNPSSSVWIKFSFRAGAGYEENWIPPAQAQTFTRMYAAVPVQVRYIEASAAPAPCPVNVTTW